MIREVLNGKSGINARVHRSGKGCKPAGMKAAAAGAA
jgi:hypothetical protein